MSTYRQMALCHSCKLHHAAPPDTMEGLEFLGRHRGHNTELFNLDKHLAKGEWVVPNNRLGAQAMEYAGNASVKQAEGTATTFTKTNANLASSATAGWMSNAIDNSSNLYPGAAVHVELAAVNTAPANSKAIFLYAYGLLNGSASAYTSTGDGTPSGSEGTLTFPDVSSLPVVMPQLGVIQYPVQNKAINAGPFEVSRCFGHFLPTKWGIAMVNHSGMTLSVTNIYYKEFYYTVV